MTDPTAQPVAPTDPPPPSAVAGLVLAAGAGLRMGGPKALLADGTGESLLDRALRALRAGGCAPLWVVLGAEADRIRALLPPSVHATVAENWAEGMGASLRNGLDALAADDDVTAVLVSLVDTPDVNAAVVQRVLAACDNAHALARATYNGRPGHPVLLGRAHWAGVRASAQGDQGARSYVAEHDVALVECGDLATGVDLDTPDEWQAWTAARR